MRSASIFIAILAFINVCVADELQHQFEKAYFLEIAKGQVEEAMEIYLHIAAEATDDNQETIQKALDRLQILYVAEHEDPFDWQQTEPYILPNFAGYFPDDIAGGIALDTLWNAPDRALISDAAILKTVRFGLRRTEQSRGLILRWIGNKYIFGKFPQHPSAIEIMYHAADSSGSNADPYGTRSHAVYYGLSVTQPKTPSILRNLAELCVRIDNPHDLNRIAWGTGSQQTELIAYLHPYLNSSKNTTRTKAEDCRQIFLGKTNAFDWARSQGQLKDISPVQRLIDQAEPGTIVRIPSGCYLGTVKVDKDITLKGFSKETTVLEAFSDVPLVRVSPMCRVQFESLTFNTSRETHVTNAPSGSCIAAYNAEVKMIDCNFKPVENTHHYSIAISVHAGRMDLGYCEFDGFNRGVVYRNGAKGLVKNCSIYNTSDYGIQVGSRCIVNMVSCTFNGSEYAVVYSDHARGSLVDCMLLNPLFCGVFIDDNCTVAIKRTIATGSHSHGIYCAGGNLVIKDSLVIGNGDLGIHIGNHSSSAELSNNAIIGNGTGISVASTKLEMSNNIILCNEHGCIDTRVSDFLSVKNNIFAGNQAGLDVGRDWDIHLMLTRNTFWNNDVTSKNFYLSSHTIVEYPSFENPTIGNYTVLNPTVKSENQGLTDPAVLQSLWQKWTPHVDEKTQTVIAQKLEQKLSESSESEQKHLMK